MAQARHKRLLVPMVHPCPRPVQAPTVLLQALMEPRPRVLQVHMARRRLLPSQRRVLTDQLSLALVHPHSLMVLLTLILVPGLMAQEPRRWVGAGLVVLPRT